MELEKIKAMSIEDVEKRCAEIAEEIKNDGADLNALNTEIDALNERKKAIKDEVALRNKLLASVASGGGEPKMNPATEERGRASLEYRKAFKEYVQTGKVSDVLEMDKRAASVGVASDLGVLLPETIIQKVMTELEGVYGQLYSKVRRTAFKGGVKYPIGSFSATYKRITETTVSERQKPGGVTGFVEFSYNIGEIRIARTLLQDVLSVEAFETEVAKVIVQAYIKGCDLEIMNGDPAKNEMTGILTEAAKTTGSRIKADHVITMTETEFLDWAKWETKLFGEIPMAMENYKPEFVMAKQTLTLLGTMKDDSGQPIKKASYDHDHKTHTFDDYPVTRVEKDILPSFAEANEGDVVAMFWVPTEAYAVNENMGFSVMHYFDQETNQYVDKAIFINDGKILNPDFLYLIKKGTAKG